MKIDRRLIILIGLGVVVIIVAMLLTFKMKQVSQQTVTFNIHNGVTVDVFPAGDVDTEHGLDQNVKPTATITQNGSTLKLAKGSYLAISKATKDYASNRVSFGVDNKSVTVDVDPPYTDAKLQSLVSTEKTAIVAALTKAFPQISSLYTIEDGWFYKTGEWYGTKLDYIGSDAASSDTLRVILHKDNGEWKVATTPPEIVLSATQHPEIPRDVISDLNAQ
ncbi:MAG TPA: hypothetical protein VLF60_00885 [Candidatus Saccharimonadales bacterium]|nr:hypothetical protein [Candidatus Saccharimonadales bacterium]